jgi:magnesium chelatase family protein
MTHLASATLEGAKARPVEVECSLIKGLPSFSIVGLADNAIMESKERVKSALAKSKITIPPYKLIVNLSPADIKKSGSIFDLPIALSIVCEVLKKKPLLENAVFLGELGLDGALKHSNQIFPIALGLAKDENVKRFVVPKESAEYLAKISSCEVFAADTLMDAFELITSAEPKPFCEKQDIEAQSLEIDGIKYFFERNFENDFEEVKGQQAAKRAAMIAAAGMHNIILEGSPGCGKSMIVKRLRHILPPASVEDVLKFAMLDFLDGKEAAFRPLRPMRAPHANTTRSALLGGGSKDGQIGEVALSSGGVLWLDELPHFDRSVIEGLREPLENYKILVSRVNSKIEYEADFLFAGSMNPCPCGNLLSSVKECRCKESEIQKYKSKLSEPFLDRVDIFVQMEEFEPNAKSGVTSAEMFEGVLRAFGMQKMRGQKVFNARLNEKELKALEVSDEALSILEQAAVRFGLSERGRAKALKVSRTIADIEESKMIQKSHILESLSFRKRS